MSQELVISKLNNMSNGISLLPGQLTRFATEADKADDILKRVKITNEETLANGVLLAKSIKTAIDNLDVSRKGFTGPLDALSADIMDQYRPYRERLVKVREEVQKRCNAFAAELQAKQDAEARERAAEAAKLAAAALAEGDVKGSQELLEVATTQDTKVTAVGSYGNKATSQRVVTGEVTNLKDFLSWAWCNLSETDLAKIDVPKSLTTKIAKQADEANKTVPGFKVNVETKAR